MASDVDPLQRAHQADVDRHQAANRPSAQDLLDAASRRWSMPGFESDPVIALWRAEAKNPRPG